MKLNLYCFKLQLGQTLPQLLNIRTSSVSWFAHDLCCFFITADKPKTKTYILPPLLSNWCRHYCFPPYHCHPFCAKEQRMVYHYRANKGRNSITDCRLHPPAPCTTDTGALFLTPRSQHEVALWKRSESRGLLIFIHFIPLRLRLNTPKCDTHR